MIVFSERLNECLASSGKSVYACSRDMGIHHTTMYGYANSYVNPTAPAIAKIARYFNVTSDWLLGLSDRKDR